MYGTYNEIAVATPFRWVPARQVDFEILPQPSSWSPAHRCEDHHPNLKTMRRLGRFTT